MAVTWHYWTLESPFADELWWTWRYSACERRILFFLRTCSSFDDWIRISSNIFSTDGWPLGNATRGSTVLPSTTYVYCSDTIRNLLCILLLYGDWYVLVSYVILWSSTVLRVVCCMLLVPLGKQFFSFFIVAHSSHPLPQIAHNPTAAVLALLFLVEDPIESAASVDQWNQIVDQSTISFLTHTYNNVNFGLHDIADGAGDYESTPCSRICLHILDPQEQHCRQQLLSRQMDGQHSTNDAVPK